MYNNTNTKTKLKKTVTITPNEDTNRKIKYLGWPLTSAKQDNIQA
jgi:hypothetical protein